MQNFYFTFKTIKQFRIYSSFRTTTFLLFQKKPIQVPLTLTADNLNSITGKNTTPNFMNSVTLQAVKAEATFKALNQDTRRGKELFNTPFIVWDLETVQMDEKQIPIILAYSLFFKGEIVLRERVVSTIDEPVSTKNIIKLIITKCIEHELCQKLTELYFFRHYGSKFDMKIVLEELYELHSKEGRLPTQISDQNYNIFQLTIERGLQKLYFRDSYKLLPASVKELGRKMLKEENLAKMEIDFKEISNAYFTGTLSKQTAEGIRLINKLSEYAKIDTIVVGKALTKFRITLRETLNLKLPINIWITVRALSIRIFKSKYISEQIPIIRIPVGSALSSFLKQGYTGGRCEVFHSGIGFDKVQYYDVKGMYRICITKDLPYGNPVYVSKFRESFSTSDWFKLLKDNKLIGFFEAEVTTPEIIHIPVLGVRNNKKLTFPLGHFEGVWRSIELELALEIGYKIKLVRGYVFRAGPVLRSFRNSLRTLKQEAEDRKDEPTRTAMKLVTNRLYGKFGASYFLSTTSIVDDDGIDILESLYKVRSVIPVTEALSAVNHSVEPKKDSEASKDLLKWAYHKANNQLTGKDTNIAIAAAITSHGRIILYRMIIDVMKQGGEMLYVDTDRIFAFIPDNPEGKALGEFTWPQRDNKNQFVNALFIAPKIYYYEDLNGNKVFKAKGASTRGREYTYESLKRIMLSNGKVTFTDQVAFKRIPRREGSGVSIEEGLIKSYTFKATKRDWYIDAGIMKTQPKQYVQEMKTVTIIELTSNPDTVIAIMKGSETIPKPTTRIFINNNTLQSANTERNTVSIELNLELLDQLFEGAWTHIIKTVQLNTYNFESYRIFKRISIILHDKENKRFATILTHKGSEWLGFNPTQVITYINEQVEQLQEQYDNTVKYRRLILITYYKFPAQMAEYRGIDALKLTAQRLIIETPLPKIEALQSKLEETQHLLKEAKAVIPAIETVIQGIAQNDITNLEEYLSSIRTAILNRKIKEYLDWNYFKIVINSTDEVKAQNILIKAIIDSIWESWKDSITLDTHTWTHNLCKQLNIKPTDERGIKIALAAVFARIVLITKEGLLILNEGGKPIIDKETGEYTYRGKNWGLPVKWASLFNVVIIQFMLNKVRLAPKVLDYVKGINNQLLSSKDKVTQINKINIVKVYLSPSYNKWIEEVLMPLVSDKEKHEQLGLIIGWKRQNEYASGITELKTIFATLSYLKAVIAITKQDYYYNIHIIDNRGRVYPSLTLCRHIGPKWLRPLFHLEGSGAEAINLPSIGYAIGNPNPWQNASYFISIAKEFNVPLNDNTTLPQFIARLQNKLKETWDFRLLARTLELWQIRIERQIKTSIPIQLDMKNNAIQHTARLINNEENIIAVGVIPGAEEDLYIKVARMRSNVVIHHRHIEWAQEVLKALPLEGEKRMDRINTLRSIVKRPVMVTAYAATEYTIKQYIRDEIKAQGLGISYTTTNILATIILDNAMKVLRKEIELMKLMQSIVQSATTLSWGFGDLSDFKVNLTYMTKENKPIKLNFGGEAHHTTYNLISNIADANKIRLSTFVNIIHSLDALHLQLIVNNYKRFNIFTIHDALLVNYNQDIRELLSFAATSFIRIHNNQKAFTHIVRDLSKRAGHNITVKEIIDKLKFRFTNIISIGIFMR